MFKAAGNIANGVVLILLLVTIGAFSLVSVQTQPIMQVIRNVMLAGLGEPTRGINIQGKPAQQQLDCDYKTGICNWK